MTPDFLLSLRLPEMLSWRLRGELKLLLLEWGQILQFAGLVVDRSPFPVWLPLFLVSDLKRGKFKAQSADILKLGRASPAASKS